MLGLSAVTDACFPDTLQPADVTEIIKIAQGVEPKLCKLVMEVIRRLPDPDISGDEAGNG